MIDLKPQGYGTHSLRRTKILLVYNKTGNLRACQFLLGHRKLESTVRDLGMEVYGVLEMSEQRDLWLATGPEAEPSDCRLWGGSGRCMLTSPAALRICHEAWRPRSTIV